MGTLDSREGRNRVSFMSERHGSQPRRLILSSPPGVAKEDDPLRETWAMLWLQHTGKNRMGLREEMCLLL